MKKPSVMTRMSSKKAIIVGYDELGYEPRDPGLPGGLPRGSAGEAGPVPPRPLPSPRSCRRHEDVLGWPKRALSFPYLHRSGS